MARNELEAALTTDEQRFVLGEMIKSSSVDVEHIANFVKSNDITPDWMNMQLPRGRNMNECIAAAEQFSLSAPTYYQPYSHPQHSPNTYAEVLRRPPPSTISDHTYNPPPPQPPPYSHQVRLLPRPPNGTTTLPPQNQLQPVQPLRATTQPTAKKKRGRPSRADRAQRELLPTLPPHLMPRPNTEPRLLAPAIYGVAPAGNPEIGPSAPQGPSRGKKRRRAASAETELTAEEGKTPGAASCASAPERRD